MIGPEQVSLETESPLVMSRGRFLRLAAGAIGAAFASQLLFSESAEAVEPAQAQPVHSPESVPEIATPERINPSQTIAINEPAPEELLEAPAPTPVPPEDKPDYWDRAVRWYEELGDPDQSIFMSIGQDLATSGIAIGAGIPLSALGIPVGNAGIKELLNDPERLALLPPPGRFMYLSSVKAPIVEELAFRAIPSAALNLVNRGNDGYSTNSSQLLSALVTSGAFAAVHNKGAVEPALPLAQFMGGMTGWRINRNAGFVHAVAGHAATNAVALGIALPTIESKRRAALAEKERGHQVELSRLPTPEVVRKTPQQTPDEQLGDLFDAFFGNHPRNNSKRPSSNSPATPRPTSYDMQRLQEEIRKYDQRGK